MDKYLFVGDIHSVPQELEDVLNLVKYIENIIIKHKPSKVIFMGDLFHTHDVLSAKVIDFWVQHFNILLKYLSKEQLVILKGNHDISDSNDDFSPSAVTIFQDILTVVNICLEDEHFLYMPYYVNHDKFKEICNKSSKNIVLCHQAFNGCQYENGFYMPHGLEASDIKQSMVITGHIHKHQKVDKIFYTGSPRWRSVSDSNENKYVWLLNIDFDTLKYRWNGYSTKYICKPIISIDINESNINSFYDTHNILKKQLNRTLYINLYGDKEFIIKNKERILTHLENAKIRIFENQDKNIKIKESQGLSKALAEYIQHTKTINGTNKEELYKLAKERISWL